MTMGLNAVSGKTVYVEVGQMLELKPNNPSSEPFKSILWRFSNNKLAEYDPDFKPSLKYYGTFKPRTNLDVKTGLLKVTGLNEIDSGEYKVEFSPGPELYYTVAVINQVPTPVINVSSSCYKEPPPCSITCEAQGIANAELVTFSWKVGQGPWDHSGKNLIINKTDGDTFTCKIKNQVSEKESQPINNPLVPPNPNVLAIVLGLGISFGFVALVLASQFVPALRKKRDALFKCSKGEETGDVNAEGTDKPLNPVSPS